jgi:RNA polymerase sigma-70 factor (ECF subfamily)
MKINQTHIDRLVEETQKGNTKAFGEIYDVYYGQIHKYVYYKVSSDHVDDVVGSVFIKAWSNIKKYRKGAFPFSSWLFRIAHNAVIDHYRTNKEFYELEEKIADESMSPQLFAEKQLNGERVHHALRKLSSNYQEVILLKYMQDLSNKEIAKALNTNETNIRTMQFRALKKLREVLEEQERMAEQQLQKKEETTEKQGLFRRLFARS